MATAARGEVGDVADRAAGVAVAAAVRSGVAVAVLLRRTARDARAPIPARAGAAESDGDALETRGCAESAPSAHAVGAEATAAPTPNIKANAPMRPTKRPAPMAAVASAIFDPEIFDPEIFDPEIFDPEIFDPEIFDSEIFDSEIFDSEIFDSEIFDSELKVSEILMPAI